MAAIHKANLGFSTELRAELIRPDGSSLDCGIVAADGVSVPKWRRVFNDLRRGGHLPFGMTFAAFLAITLSGHPLAGFVMGVVTTAGVNALASNSLNLYNFNYHDSGTGTTSAITSNTALATPTGTARVYGTQTNPTAGKFMTTATITYASAFAVTEWGLFNVAAAGTMWDRKRLAALNVLATGQIIFGYSLTVKAGG